MISGDEELLELQREFEKSKPSVKIIKKSEKKSIFAQRQNFALPSKIDSNTELFGTVLSNIKERHADDSNAPVLKHPSGFPIAQHRSIQPLKMHSGQETGNEIHDANMKYLGGMSAEQIKEAQEEIYATFSKETIEIIKKNAAKKYGNKEKESSGDELETNNVSKPVDEGLMKMDEEKKLEWTKEIPMAVQDQMRLDFHGCILDSGVEYGSISGLYHHGDQPDRAGYTIEELVHLTKSTFPSQRAFSLQIISLIVEKIYSQSYSPQNCKDITAKLKKENIALVSRIGMDAKHETVYCMAINLLATILGYHNNGRAMNEHLLMLSLYSSKTVLNLETTISMELDSQIGFKKKRNGEKVEPIELENDMETILKLLQSDIILGLLLSNITTRVRYLLRIVSSDEHKLQLIYILTCIAQHSPSSAEDILATEDLVDTLSDILFNPTWPAVEGLRLDIIFNALNLIGILCRSSYESAVAITRSTLVSRIVRFISIYHLEKAHLDIVKAVFTIFDTLFVYGLSASIIDSYRALFLDFAEKISTIFPMDSDGNISENSAVIESFATFLRMLKTSLEKFRAQLDAGGINDAYVPFVELVLRTLKTSGIKFQESKVYNSFYCAALDFLYVYFKQATTFQFQPSKNCVELQSEFYNYAELLSLNISTLPLIQMEQAPFQLFDGGVATSVCKDVFGLVEKLHQFSRDCCTLASQLNLMSFEVQKYGTTHQYENLDRLSMFVNQIVGPDLNIPSDYWISIFAHGVFKFLESWISFNSAIYLRNKEIVNKEMVIKCVNWYCTLALPGLDYTAHRLLTTVLLSKEWIGQDFTRVQQCFDTQFNIKSLSNSNAFTVLNPSKHPKSLMIQVQQFDQTVLPIQKDWIFKFPAGFKNNQISSVDDVLLWLEFVTVGISESIISKQSWEINRIYSVMHLFFLSDESGHEIYRNDRVNDLLAKLLELLTDSIYESYDEGFLEKIPNFFNLYQDFIDHFIATSFGDRVFARYILVPIAMKFPHDFRAAFWGKLFDYYKFFDLEEDALPGKSLAPFMSPLDTNMDMKILYKKAMLGGRLRKESFLYKIASQY